MGAAIGGLIGGVGSLVGGLTSSGSDSKAAQQSLTGYNYLTGANGVTGYVANGTGSNSAAAALLGVGGTNTTPTVSDPQQYIAALAPYNNKNYPNIQKLVGDLQQGIANAQELQGALGMITTNNAGARSALTGLNTAVTNALAAPASTSTGSASSASATAQNNAFSNYLNSTGYQFQLGQGLSAINQSAAAKGLLNSGATAKALQSYGQGLAGQTFNNYLTQLGDLGSAGLTASGQIGSAGSSGGASASTATQNSGSALGNGIASFGSTLGAAASNYFGASAPPSNGLSGVTVTPELQV